MTKNNTINISDLLGLESSSPNTESQNNQNDIISISNLLGIDANKLTPPKEGAFEPFPKEEEIVTTIEPPPTNQNISSDELFNQEIDNVISKN